MAEINKLASVAAKPTGVKAALPAIVLATSFYYSFSFTTAIVVGYITSKFFCHYFVNNGKVSCTFIDYGKWKIHLHHWIIGLAILTSVWVLDYFYLPTIFAGFMIGIIIQDIYDFNDWHLVVMKKEEK